jgi:hypothetical protein
VKEPSTRRDRRQTKRGGSTSPPRRDPMIAIYVGFAVLIAVVFGIFGVMRWREIRRVQAAYATPTPGPNATSSPIPLADGETLGKQVFPPGDTQQGGHGQPIDGMTCATQEYVTLHIHSHLALFVHGVQIGIPKFIGMTPSPTGGCLYWIHTHDASGIIHVEAPQLHPLGAPEYTLGMFFDVWGMPLSRDDVAGYKGPVTAFVNGALYTGPLAQIPLLAHQEITLEVGTPVVPPPNYTFPPDD